jgi:hypothetical protein
LREDLTLLCGVAPRPVHDPYRARFDAMSYDDGFDQAMDSPGRGAR